MNLADRVVLITGASKGIGEALARAYAAEGARVVLAARSADLLLKVAASLPPGRAMPVRADITDRLQIIDLVDRAIQRFGHIDILVNNAGVGMFSTLSDMDAVHFQQLFALNVYAPVYLVQAVLPLMKYRREGQIVNIASVVGHVALPGMGAYSASKFALRAFTDTLRLELKPFGIHVMGVYPGRIRTLFSKNAFKSAAPSPQFQSQRRGISAERCARAIVKGSLKDRREVVVPWPMHAFIGFYRWFPQLADRLIARLFQERSEPR